MPELGAFRLEAKLADPEGKLALEVLNFDVGSEELADISLNGTIKDLLALQEISLNFEVQGKDSTKLTQFGLPPPPVRSAYRASGRIFDPEVSVYTVSGLRVALGENEITGRVDQLCSRPGVQPELVGNHHLFPCHQTGSPLKICCCSVSDSARSTTHCKGCSV